MTAPSPLLTALEGRMALEPLASLAAAPVLARAPKGDGHSVIVIPPFGAAGNPVDITGGEPPSTYEATIRLGLEDPRIHALVLGYWHTIVTPPMVFAELTARVVAEFRERGIEKPVMASLAGDVEDEREVGLPVSGERGRDRDQDRVRLPHGVVVGRRRQQARARERLQNRVRDVLDVALAAVDRLDARRVEIDEDGTGAGLREDECEREAHVAGADDCYLTPRHPRGAVW